MHHTATSVPSEIAEPVLIPNQSDDQRNSSEGLRGRDATEENKEEQGDSTAVEEAFAQLCLDQQPDSKEIEGRGDVIWLSTLFLRS